MITNIDIYEIVKQALPDDFKSRYGVGRTTANDDGTIRIIPNIVTITIKPAEKPVRDIGGRIIRNYKRVLLSVYSDRGGREAIESGELACEQIKETLNKLHNVKASYTDSDGNTKELRIIDSQILIDTNYLGMTEQGIHRFSLEYKIAY